MDNNSFLKTRVDFIEWLFDNFKVPESSQLQILSKYEGLKPDLDFEKLKETVLEEWKSNTTLPSCNWLNYNAKKHSKKYFGKLDPAVIKARKDKALHEFYFEECLATIRTGMNAYRKKLGKLQKEYYKCF